MNEPTTEEEIIERLRPHNIKWAYERLIEGKAVRRAAPGYASVWKVLDGKMFVLLNASWVPSAFRTAEKWLETADDTTPFAVVEGAPP